MRWVFDVFMIGLAIIFFNSLQGCAGLKPETAAAIQEQAMCVSLCSIEASIAKVPETPADAAIVAADCMAKCLVGSK